MEKVKGTAEKMLENTDHNHQNRNRPCVFLCFYCFCSHFPSTKTGSVVLNNTKRVSREGVALYGVGAIQVVLRQALFESSPGRLARFMGAPPVCACHLEHALWRLSACSDSLFCSGLPLLLFKFSLLLLLFVYRAIRCAGLPLRGSFYLRCCSPSLSVV